MGLEWLYCENNTTWAVYGLRQPLNVTSNLVFCALAGWYWHSAAHRLNRYGLVLIALGSVAWHASQTRAGLVLDLAAIMSWVLLFALDVGRVSGRVAEPLTRRGAVISLAIGLGILGVCGVVALVSRPVLPMLSAAFLPGVVVGGYLAFRTHGLVRVCWALSALSMAVAIVLREGDQAFCATIPVGTHFLWHICAGLALLGPLQALHDQHEQKLISRQAPA